jgi:hypothetical protein
MFVLCTYRPCDPGVEIERTREDRPPLTGWMVMEFTQAQVNYMLDSLAWYNTLIEQRNSVLNVAIAHSDPNPAIVTEPTGAITLYMPSEDMAIFWQRSRGQQTDRVATFADPPNLPTSVEVREVEGVQVDVILDRQGIWLQLFLPDIQICVETPIMPASTFEPFSGIAPRED